MTKQILKNLGIIILATILTVSVLGCKPKKKATKLEKTTKTETHVFSIEEKKGQLLLEKCLSAHGGIDKWNSFEGLEYNLVDNGKQVYQLTQLKDRRAYLKSKKYEVGFNGEVAWSVPDASQVSGKSAAFYYNLDFYFIGIPFLLKDPGVSVIYNGKYMISEKEYESIRITFGAGIGLSPKDVYYLYFDPKTFELNILTYSISYFDSENARIKSAKVYSDYRKVQGLIMPHKMENFEWADGAMGKSKNHLRLFSNINFLLEIPDESLFEVPEGAVIEKLDGK